MGFEALFYKYRGLKSSIARMAKSGKADSGKFWNKVNQMNDIKDIMNGRKWSEMSDTEKAHIGKVMREGDKALKTDVKIGQALQEISFDGRLLDLSEFKELEAIANGESGISYYGVLVRYNEEQNPVYKGKGGDDFIETVIRPFVDEVNSYIDGD